jgi:hypothetical protein
VTAPASGVSGADRDLSDRLTLEVGERIELAWHGANHSPDNIIIHLPDHDTLMLVDIVNLTEDIPLLPALRPEHLGRGAR